MASLTRRRMPSAKPPLAPCSVRSCRTVFKSSGFVWWVVMDLLWMCLLTPQQETIMARPRPVLGGGSPPSGAGGPALCPPPPAPPPPPPRRPRRGAGRSEEEPFTERVLHPPSTTRSPVIFTPFVSNALACKRKRTG